MDVTEEVPLSLNCTISGDGSYTWERRDGIAIENAKRHLLLLGKLNRCHHEIISSFKLVSKMK